MCDCVQCLLNAACGERPKWEDKGNFGKHALTNAEWDRDRARPFCPSCPSCPS